MSERAGARRPLAPVATGTGLVLLTYVTTNTTLPATVADLGADLTGRAWIVSAMSIGLAASLLPVGIIGDRLGRRRLYLAGLIAVIAGALVCAVSWEPWLFVAARLVQGAGGAAVIACGLATLAHAYPPGRERNHATSVWGASLGAGIASGSVVAMILTFGSGWRENYAFTVLIGLLLLVPSLRRIPESRSPQPRRLDLAGLVLLVAMMVLAVATLTRIRAGLDLVAVVLTATTLAAILGLVIVEWRVRQPLIDTEILRHPRFLATTLGALTLGAGMVSMASFLPIVAQDGFGDTVQLANIPPLIWAVTSTLTALLARYLPRAFAGPWAIATLLVLTGAGMLTATPATSAAGLIVSAVLTGITTGLLNAVLSREAVASVPTDHAAMASGANNTARYLGAACGITVFTVVSASTGGSIADGWEAAVATAVAITIVGAITVALQGVARRRVTSRS